ncbi:VWA-like domain-containing protein, partial [uncultured Clostridium sp.]|uniref:vWA domain-containing protein n=1 Tax=uncultured Clostridium sp. TaxID=59620 RepID=UPI0025CFA2CC
MERYFEKKALELYKKIDNIVDNIDMFKSNAAGIDFTVDLSEDIKKEFFYIVDKVILSLMEDKDNFYGYFLFQMRKEIRFDISTPTAVNFKNAKYFIYFNPILFLQLNIKQMGSTIKHEILHILSLHLIRAKDIKGKFSTLAVNLAMDIVVNQYLDNLPPYAVTVQSVNQKYSLELEPYNTFEYYVTNIQKELDLLEEDEEGEKDDTRENSELETEFNAEYTHDMWEENNDIEEQTLKNFTEKLLSYSQKGTIPKEVSTLIDSLKSNKSEIPWNIYLKKLMGTIESNRKKTVTRLNRRQPHRLELRGELRNHKANVAVAIDISGSISDEEFCGAIKEIFSIVKNYNEEITIIECDNKIRRSYKVKKIKDVQERIAKGGGTKFSPVFKYANQKNINLLIYFTDGKGEERLEVKPIGYKILWVITGRGKELSLKEPYGAVKVLKEV